MNRELYVLKPAPSTWNMDLKAHYMGPETLMVKCPNCFRTIYIQKEEKQKQCDWCGLTIGEKSDASSARLPDQAIRELIEAEWEFRLGRRAYSTEAQDKLLKAERRLRRSLAGQGELDAAYKELRRCIRESPKNPKSATD